MELDLEQAKIAINIINQDNKSGMLLVTNQSYCRVP
jgi:hypothetical protein